MCLWTKRRDISTIHHHRRPPSENLLPSSPLSTSRESIDLLRKSKRTSPIHPVHPIDDINIYASTLITGTSYNRSRHLSNAIRSRSVVPHQRKKIATYPIAYHLVTRDIPSSHPEQPTRSFTPNAKGSSTFDCSYFWTGLLGEWRRVVRADAPY